MLERGLNLLVLLRQRDPALNTKQPITAAACVRWRALGMRNATSGNHEIHRAGRNFERIPLAVAMHYAPIKQVGNRGKPDMRVGPHI